MRPIPLCAAAVFTAALLAACATTPPANGSSTASAPIAASPEFEVYQLVLLRRGPSWTPGSTEALKELQAQHLAHLGAMAEQGKMVAAGPFGDQDDETLRGLCLYRVGSVDEARGLAEQDPMVQAGRLKVEVMSWYTEKGYVVFPRAPKP